MNTAVGKAKKKASDRNRRRWERLPLAIPVFVRGVDPHGNRFLEFATALDISAGGALLAVRRHLPAGSKISLEIPCAPLPAAASSTQTVKNLPAKLIRASASEQHHLLALQFSRPLLAQDGAPSPAKRKTVSRK